MANNAESRPLDWRRELLTGLVLFVQSAPAVIGVGTVAFSALGPSYVSGGMKAAVCAAAFAVVLTAIFGGTKFQWTNPRVTLAAVFGALAAELINDPLVSQVASHGSTPPEATVVTLLFFSVFLAGALQVVFGLLRLGQLIKYIPYPVIAGFMNGIAVILLLGQLPKLFGLNNLREFPKVFAGEIAFGWQPLLVAVFTYAIMRLVKKLKPSIPPAVVILCVGTGLYHLGALVSGGWFTIPTLAAIPAGLPTPSEALAIFELLGNPHGFALAGKVIGAAFTLAIIGSLQSLVSATLADSLSHTHHDSNRELIGQGIANTIAGLFGGLASGGAASLVPAAYALGSRSPISRFVAGALFLLVALGLGAVFAYVPVVVVALILLLLAGVLVNDWTKKLFKRLFEKNEESRRRDVLANLTIAIGVTILILTVGMVIAIGTGMSVALLFFMRTAGQRVIRRHYRGDRGHSRVVRPPVMADLLETHGGAIQVFEVQGPIFFGTSDELARRIEELSEEAETIIVDLRRVSEIDSTGAMILGRLDRVLASKKKTLALTYLTEGQEIYTFLRDMGLLNAEMRRRVFDDTDMALAWAEDEILTRIQGDKKTHGPIDMRKATVMQGIKSEQVWGLISEFLVRETYEPGQQIIADGEKGNRLFYLMSGRVAVTKQLPDRKLRLFSLRPGTVFGEMALLAGQPRSANVHATTDVVCLSLSHDAFEKLCAQRPEIGIRMLLNISREMSRRLATMGKTLQELEK